jgi:hypothetical protein
MVQVIELVFGFLLKLFPSLISAYNKTLDANVAKYKVDGTVDIEALKASIVEKQATRDIIIAEQGNWLTRLPRPLMGLSVAAYVFKFLVWDKVLGHWTHGFTDGVDGYSATIVGIILGGYFLHGTVSDAIRQIKR